MRKIIIILFRMQINFDELEQVPQASSNRNASPIKLEIESPIFEKITKSISPQSYRSQIQSMGIKMPQRVSEFITREIDKQIHSQSDIATKTILESDETRLQTEKETEVKIPKKKEFREKKKSGKGTGWVFNYKKHKCEPQHRTQVKAEAENMAELTLHPKLYPNRFNCKAEVRKVNTLMGKKYSVYDHLYQEAIKRQQKQRIKRQEKIETKPRKPQINHNYFQREEKEYIPIINRLSEVLQKRQRKKNDSQNFDLTTGREMFHPDLNSSRQSFKIFCKSLSKQKIIPREYINPNKEEKEVKVQKKAKGNYEGKMDLAVVNFYADLFYPEDSNALEIMNGLDSIEQNEFNILQPFLHRVEEIESKQFQIETTISSVKIGGNLIPNKQDGAIMPRKEFKEHLLKFYLGLSLYDRQILRFQSSKRKRRRAKDYREVKINEKFHPTINVRSSSLDDLAQGHNHRIYFV